MSKKTTIVLMALAALFAVTSNVMADPGGLPSVPDAGSSALLMTAACAGLFTVRRFLGNAK